MAPKLSGRPTRAEIDLDNLAFNFRSSRDFVGRDLKVMAVVKADAYGHGAVECSRRLESEGVDWLAVALPEEGLELRMAGISVPILCLGGFWDGQPELLLQNGITPALLDLGMAAALDVAASSHGVVLPIHVKIDTGMGRVGVPFDRVAEAAAALRRYTNLRVEGLMSHFAAADDPAEKDFTSAQLDRFREAIDVFRAAGHEPTIIDLANSPGAVTYADSRLGMVRLGGLLYGLGRDILPAGAAMPEIRPVMSLKTAVTQIKNVRAGASLGYGRTFVTGHDSIIATVPIGYRDGYPRAMSNRARVIVNGRYAPVAGRVSMDWTIIDVTDIPGVEVGSEVTLIGRDGSLSVTAEELAGISNTISYEITCGIGSRVPRVSVAGGRQTHLPEPKVTDV